MTNEELINSYYRKVLTSLSEEVTKNIADNGGVPPTMTAILDSVGQMINKFTKFYMETALYLESDEYSEEEAEACVNLVREHLLELGAESDFMPTEDFVTICCRDIVNLIYYTDTILDKKE